jgi:hypothetical protein
MLSVITNIYKKKIKGPTLVELFTATGKLKKVFLLEMFDVCTTGDTAYVDSQHGCIDILQSCNDPCLKARIIAAMKNIDVSMLTRVW